MLMNKKEKTKLIICIVLAVLLAVGGFAGYRIYSEQQRQNALIEQFSALSEYNSDLNKRYIAYYDAHNEVDITEILALVNNGVDESGVEYDSRIYQFIQTGEYNGDLLQRYLNYSNQYNAPANHVVLLVNNNADNYRVVYDDRLKEIMEDRYFLASRAKRYVDYDAANEGLSVRDLVASVNCNLDIEPFSGKLEANLKDGYQVLVNKYYNLPSDYTPENLVDVDEAYCSEKARMEATAYENLVRMINDCKAESGVKIRINGDNGYRSYIYQQTVYDYYCKMLGPEKGEARAAHPGYSEHQTGLAVDLSASGNNFNWVIANCHKYGFILRYPEESTELTGYTFERWHYRYVGEEVATYIHENSITYDEYYAYFILKH